MLHHLSRSCGSILLSPMTAEESEWYRELRNREDNREWFINRNIITKEQQRQWFESYLKKQSEYMFSVYLCADYSCTDYPCTDYLCTDYSRTDYPYTETARQVGGLGLYDVDRKKGQCEAGRILIDRRLAGGMGLGALAYRCLLEIAFEELGLDMVYARVYEDNPAGLKSCLNAGFEQRGFEEDGNGRRLCLLEKRKAGQLL